MRHTFTSALLLAVSLALPAASLAENGQASGEDASATVKVQAPSSPPTKEELAEARRLAREERAREEARLRLERERSCLIKPVMTDAEIAHCKEVWR